MYSYNITYPLQYCTVQNDLLKLCSFIFISTNRKFFKTNKTCKAFKGGYAVRKQQKTVLSKYLFEKSIVDIKHRLFGKVGGLRSGRRPRQQINKNWRNPPTRLFAQLQEGFSRTLSLICEKRKWSEPQHSCRGCSIAADVYRALVELIIHRCYAGRPDESFPDYTLRTQIYVYVYLQN